MAKYLCLCDGDAPVHVFDRIEKDLLILPPEASGEKRFKAVEEAEVIFGEPTLEELTHAKSLRWVQMFWAGADRYLHGGFPEKVLLTTASGAFGETIAEHAVGMLFALCRRFPAYAKSCQWADQGCEKEISGGRALIFGCGDIGTAIAKRLKALGVHTTGVCRSTGKKRPFFDDLVTLETAQTALTEADFVLCALPANEQTAGYLNEERLSSMKEDALLINVGRGSFIALNCLTKLLQEGKFFGAGLDVTDPEPLPEDHPLWQLPNVILTPHVAGVSFGHLKSTEEKIWEICRENLENYLTGKPLRNLVELP